MYCIGLIVLLVNHIVLNVPSHLDAFQELAKSEKKSFPVERHSFQNYPFIYPNIIIDAKSCTSCKKSLIRLPLENSINVNFKNRWPHMNNRKIVIKPDKKYQDLETYQELPIRNDLPMRNELPNLDFGCNRQEAEHPIMGYDELFGYKIFENYCHLQQVNNYFKYNFRVVVRRFNEQLQENLKNQQLQERRLPYFKKMLPLQDKIKYKLPQSLYQNQHHKKSLLKNLQQLYNLLVILLQKQYENLKQIQELVNYLFILFREPLFQKNQRIYKQRSSENQPYQDPEFNLKDLAKLPTGPEHRIHLQHPLLFQPTPNTYMLRQKPLVSSISISMTQPINKFDNQFLLKPRQRAYDQPILGRPIHFLPALQFNKHTNHHALPQYHQQNQRSKNRYNSENIFKSQNQIKSSPQLNYRPLNYFSLKVHQNPNIDHQLRRLDLVQPNPWIEHQSRLGSLAYHLTSIQLNHPDNYRSRPNVRYQYKPLVQTNQQIQNQSGSDDQPRSDDQPGSDDQPRSKDQPGSDVQPGSDDQPYRQSIFNQKTQTKHDDQTTYNPIQWEYLKSTPDTLNYRYHLIPSLQEAKPDGLFQQTEPTYKDSQTSKSLHHHNFPYPKNQVQNKSILFDQFKYQLLNDIHYKLTKPKKWVHLSTTPDEQLNYKPLFKSNQGVYHHLPSPQLNHGVHHLTRPGALLQTPPLIKKNQRTYIKPITFDPPYHLPSLKHRAKIHNTPDHQLNTQPLFHPTHRITQYTNQQHSLYFPLPNQWSYHKTKPFVQLDLQPQFHLTHRLNQKFDNNQQHGLHLLLPNQWIYHKAKPIDYLDSQPPFDPSHLKNQKFETNQQYGFKIPLPNQWMHYKTKPIDWLDHQPLFELDRKVDHRPALGTYNSINNGIKHLQEIKPNIWLPQEPLTQQNKPNDKQFVLGSLPHYKFLLNLKYYARDKKLEQQLYHPSLNYLTPSIHHNLKTGNQHRSLYLVQPNQQIFFNTTPDVQLNHQPLFISNQWAYYQPRLQSQIHSRPPLQLNQRIYQQTKPDFRLIYLPILQKPRRIYNESVLDNQLYHQPMMNQNYQKELHTRPINGPYLQSPSYSTKRIYQKSKTNQFKPLRIALSNKIYYKTGPINRPLFKLDRNPFIQRIQVEPMLNTFNFRNNGVQHPQATKSYGLQIQQNQWMHKLLNQQIYHTNRSKYNPNQLNQPFPLHWGYNQGSADHYPRESLLGAKQKASYKTRPENKLFYQPFFPSNYGVQRKLKTNVNDFYQPYRNPQLKSYRKLEQQTRQQLSYLANHIKIKSPLFNLNLFPQKPLLIPKPTNQIDTQSNCSYLKKILASILRRKTKEEISLILTKSSSQVLDKES